MTTPLVVFLHGLGDSGRGWSHIKHELGLSGVRYIFPDAPVQPVSCNGGMTMTSWMDLQDIPVTKQNVDDHAGLETSTKMIHAILDAEVAKGTPSTSIVLGGFSQGCAMAVLAGYAYDKPLAGIIGFSGWAAKKDEWGEIVGKGANAKTPAFIAHGEYDNVVEPDCGAEIKDLLTKHGVEEVNYSTYGMAHSSHPAQMVALTAWLKDLLKL